MNTMNYFNSIYEKYFPFWQSLCDEDKEYLCDNSAVVSFDRHQPVHDSVSCTGLFLVNSGRLRIYMLSDEGKEITLYRLSEGEVCMLSASCVLQSITFDVYVDAEEESECCMISPAVFSDVSERVPDVKIFALETAVQRFSDVMWVMQQIVFMSMDKRLAIFLSDECASKGTDTVSMTHEQIARHLGTAREVVTRTLKHFVSDGVIEVTRKGIIVKDKNKLRSIIG